MNAAPPQGPHSSGWLTERDQINVRAFLGSVLDRFKAGTLTKDDAIGALTHVIAAIDQGDREEARRWFEEGQKSSA